MRVAVIGQKYLGAAVWELCRRTPGVRTVAAIGRPEDRLCLAAREDGAEVVPASRLGSLASGADLLLAAHCQTYLPADFLSRFPLGCLAYHPSLLPLHRGRDAIAWALRDRDRVTGGTVYWMTDEIDGGPVAAQDWCFIRPGDDPMALWRRDLAPMGIRLFKTVLGELLQGHRPATPQDEALATWEPPFPASRPSPSAIFS